MNKLKVIFVGVGSIAKRHIKNLFEVCKTQGYFLTIDVFRHNNRGEKEIYDLGVDKIYTELNNTPDDYDVVFITNPTEYHLETLWEFHEKGKHFFIEKPVSSISQLHKIKDLQFRKDSVYYVAAPLRYHAVIQYIKDNVNVNDVISVRCISSSYLPEWRPGIDYRTTYSANKKLGGGVSIDLIHEWDYITYLFGMPNKVNCFIGKKSNLEIDSDDYAIYIAEYDDKIAEIHLDYFGRETIRNIELFTNSDTIVGDLVNHKISFLKSGEKIIFDEKRDDFQKREMLYFLKCIQEKVEEGNQVERAMKVLKITQGEL